MKRTVDLDTASSLLGISKDAVRKRIKRGTIEAVKDDAGHWKVFVDDSDRTKGYDTGDGQSYDTSGQLVRQMEKEIEFLRAELERKDHILMNLTNKIPQLEQPKQQDKDRDKPDSWWSRLWGNSK